MPLVLLQYKADRGLKELAERERHDGQVTRTQTHNGEIRPHHQPHGSPIG